MVRRIDVADESVAGALSGAAARQLSTVTKSAPQWSGITPRWLVPLLEWVPVEAGVYRVDRVAEPKAAEADVVCSPEGDADLPESFVDYETNPREFTLNAVTTVLEVQTRVSDLYQSPHDQVREQLRLTVEKVKERQERQLFNNEDYGLLHQVTPEQRIKTRTGAPTPDDLDALIAKVWKQPSYFLAHPDAVAAIGRECTRRGVPPATTNIFGGTFLTWRGIPIIPTDKIDVEKGKTTVLLVRIGYEKQGVIGLFQPGVPGEVGPSLSVRFMGIDKRAVASYLVSLYCSAAVLSPDAIGALDNVDVTKFHEYA
jgi:hypothetical protein